MGFANNSISSIVSKHASIKRPHTHAASKGALMGCCAHKVTFVVVRGVMHYLHLEPVNNRECDRARATEDRARKITRVSRSLPSASTFLNDDGATTDSEITALRSCVFTCWPAMTSFGCAPLTRAACRAGVIQVRSYFCNALHRILSHAVP